MIRAVVTDLDGVIRHFPRERDEAIEQRHGLDLGSLARTAFEPALLQRVITGRISDPEWREEIARELRAEAAVAAWTDFPGEFNAEVFQFLRVFAGARPLALLTNATSRLPSDLRQAGYLEKFNRIFNSSEIGHAKPAPEIFQHVCESLGLSPQELLFIDDSLKNIEAARALGFRAIQFRDLSQLRASLAEQAIT